MISRTGRGLLVAVALLVGGAVLGAAFYLLESPRPGSAVASSAIGGPFRLTDQNGRTVTDQDLKGRPFLVFFGYTHCPDVCPTTLFDVSEIFTRLGPDADRVGALFVTVDPERDTPATLKDYMASFDPHLRGLTGDPAAVAATEKAYRVYSKKVPLDEGDYAMDHTSIVYLMDKDGQFVRSFNLKRKPEEAAADLRQYL